MDTLLLLAWEVSCFLLRGLKPCFRSLERFKWSFGSGSETLAPVVEWFGSSSVLASQGDPVVWHASSKLVEEERYVRSKLTKLKVLLAHSKSLTPPQPCFKKRLPSWIKLRAQGIWKAWNGNYECCDCNSTLDL